MDGYGTEGFRFTDPGVRLLEEEDIPGAIRLYRLNYGEGYAFPRLYDPGWYRQSIHGGHAVWVVLEEDGEIVGTGALTLDQGRPGDRIAEIGRMAVHPAWQERGVGRRVHDALLEVAAGVAEFAFGTARTVHAAIQAMADGAGFTPAGFLPRRYDTGNGPESFILYAWLSDSARTVRSREPPHLIPEAAPLARHVLCGMGLPDALRVEEVRAPCPDAAPGRDGEPAGAPGYRVDARNGVLTGTDLVAETDGERGHLCAALSAEAERLRLRMAEANVSAYDPRLQRTLADRGFVPVAYLPAMVLHGGRRLDVVRMVRLLEPYRPAPMKLTGPARAVAALVEPALPRAL